LEERFLTTPRPSGRSLRLLPLALLAAEVADSLPALSNGGGDDLISALDLDRLAREGLYHHFADYHGQVREDVLPFVPSGAVDVLEVGCGFGGTGRLLAERLGCRVWGVEVNPAAAAEASKHLHRVWCGDIAALEIAETFDAVIATELFEHLPEGEAVLLRLTRLVRPGGRIILSVPNVGHYSVVLDLLAGRWDYLPIGLLCYTHYRFFTRATLADWLRRLDLRTFELIAQPTELPVELERLAGLEVDRESLSTKGYYVLIGL
jgi:SAM-dependent methyltransferase